MEVDLQEQDMYLVDGILKLMKQEKITLKVKKLNFQKVLLCMLSGQQ